MPSLSVQRSAAEITKRTFVIVSPILFQCWMFHAWHQGGPQATRAMPASIAAHFLQDVSSAHESMLLT